MSTLVQGVIKASCYMSKVIDFKMKRSNKDGAFYLMK